MSFTFGPVQTMFLEALESGIYTQAHQEFHNWENHSFCALGLANEVCQLGEKDSHVFLYDTHKKLGLFSYMGECVDRNAFGTEVVAGPSIAIMNDEIKMTFPEIAAHLRKHATQYFAFSI